MIEYTYVTIKLPIILGKIENQSIRHKKISRKERTKFFRSKLHSREIRSRIFVGYAIFFFNYARNEFHTIHFHKRF